MVLKTNIVWSRIDVSISVFGKCHRLCPFAFTEVSYINQIDLSSDILGQLPETSMSYGRDAAMMNIERSDMGKCPFV